MKKLRYLFFLLIISIFVELFLRHMGFGDPITYISSKYKYYPKSNQQNNRYKGAHIKINRLGMRTNSNWDNYTNKNKQFINEVLVVAYFSFFFYIFSHIHFHIPYKYYLSNLYF